LRVPHSTGQILMLW